MLTFIIAFYNFLLNTTGPYLWYLFLYQKEKQFYDTRGHTTEKKGTLRNIFTKKTVLSIKNVCHYLFC